MLKKFLKWLLGLNKYCTNNACRASMGRFPMKINAQCRNFKFWLFLINRDLACINRVGGLYGRILTEVASTHWTQWGLYQRARSRTKTSIISTSSSSSSICLFHLQFSAFDVFFISLRFLVPENLISINPGLKLKFCSTLCIYSVPPYALLRVTICVVITVSQSEGSTVYCKLELQGHRQENCLKFGLILG